MHHDNTRQDEMFIWAGQLMIRVDSRFLFYSF